MKITATLVRVGNIIKLNNELYNVTWRMHRTPGKGDACIQTKLKNIISGKNMEHRFRSSDKVEKVSLDTERKQFLYAEPDGFIFMDNETYEQMTLVTDFVGDKAEFLVEGNSYDITLYEGQPVGIELPLTMDFRVVSAPPAIKNATATSSMEPVELENGMFVNVPAFVKTEDVIRVKTETKEYMERV